MAPRTTSRRRTAITTVGVGIAGVVGGGLLAATLSATAADAGTQGRALGRGPAGAYGMPGGPQGGMPRGPMGDHDGDGMRGGMRGGMPGGMRGGPMGSPVSDAVAAEIESAVLAAYPGATVQDVHAETDASGGVVYEAHVVTKAGALVHVLLDQEFTVTGEEQRPATGGSGRPAPGRAPDA